MKGKNAARIILLVLFILFVGLYFTSNSSYFDYEARAKSTLTKEQIKQFEQDVKNGKNIDVKEYLKLNEKNYDNAISKTTMKVSKAIGDTISKSIDFLFKKLDGAMN